MASHGKDVLQDSPFIHVSQLPKLVNRRPPGNVPVGPHEQNHSWADTWQRSPALMYIYQVQNAMIRLIISYVAVPLAPTAIDLSSLCYRVDGPDNGPPDRKREYAFKVCKRSLPIGAGPVDCDDKPEV